MLEQNDVAKLATMLSGQYNGNQEATGAPYEEDGAQNEEQKLILKQSIADAKMTALMGETLAQKEKIIVALQSELEQEQKRRKDFKSDFKHQVKEYELDRKAIENIKRQSDAMERAKQKKEQEGLRKESELDFVPTKQSAKTAKPSKYQLKDHPIFFKNSSIKSVIPKQAPLHSSAKKLVQKTKTLQGDSITKQVSFTLPSQPSQNPLSIRQRATQEQE